MLVMVVQAAVGLIETYFVGKLGTDALAGVALVFPVLMLMQMMSAGAMGGGISSAIAPGHARGWLELLADGRSAVRPVRTRHGALFRLPGRRPAAVAAHSRECPPVAPVHKYGAPGGETPTTRGMPHYRKSTMLHLIASAFSSRVESGVTNMSNHLINEQEVDQQLDQPVEQPQTLSEQAQGLVEYGLIIALVAVLAIAGLIVFGPAVSSLLSKLGGSV
jgi:hypothetical protein